MSPFSVRTVLSGTLLCLVISVAAPYANLYMQGSMLALDFGTSAAIFLLFLFLGVNTALSRLHRGLAFGQREQAVIYVMMITACSIPTMGLMEYMLPGLTALSYYSTPENSWQQLIQLLANLTPVRPPLAPGSGRSARHQVRVRLSRQG